MCTYNLSFNDAVVDRIRPAFKDDIAIQAWMLKQIEMAIMQFELSNTNDSFTEEEEKKAFLYTSRVNASKMFAKYL